MGHLSYPPVRLLTRIWKEFILLFLLSLNIGLVLLLIILSVFVLHYICAPASDILFVQPCSSVFFLPICLLDVWVSILLQLIIEASNVSISGIPNNAEPFRGRTKKLHNLCLSHLIAMLQMPNCGIAVITSF